VSEDPALEVGRSAVSLSAEDREGPASEDLALEVVRSAASLSAVLAWA
jgi:hypothetical protein